MSQNTDNYGAIEDNGYPNFPQKEANTGPSCSAVKVIGIFFVLGSIVALAVTDNFVLTKSSSTSLKKAKKSSTVSDINWSIYKHTTSVTTGTYSSVNDFVSTYITYVSDIVDLGCGDSMKVVGDLAVPSSDEGVYGFEEIHWVDSSVFPQAGLSIGEWSDYVASLGTSDYNSFMYNKVQLYVPDLSGHYQSLVADKINTVLRLSKSSGSSSYDTAHIGIPVFQAANMYEIVGPSSSLTSDQLDAFTAWSDVECPEAHNLAYSLSELNTLYTSATFSTGMTNWTASTGKPVPMGVGIIIPASNLEYITDTMDLITDVTSGSTVTQTGLGAKGGCTISTISIGDDTHFEPTVRYVINSEVAQGTDYTVADWEQAVALTHETYLNKSSVYDQWDRYLDTHVGILSYYSEDASDDATQCAANELAVETALQESSQQPSYSMRDSEGLHYYVGTSGLKCWEFNAFGCPSTESDICGCVASNNNDEYVADYGVPCGDASRKQKK